jgi:hypothetical protein
VRELDGSMDAVMGGDRWNGRQERATRREGEREDKERIDASALEKAKKEGNLVTTTVVSPFFSFFLRVDLG